MKNKKRSTFSYFFQFGKKYKKSYLLASFSNIISSLLGFVVIPLFFKILLDTFSTFDGIDKTGQESFLMGIWLTMLVIDFVSFVIIQRIAVYATSYFQIHLKNDLENFCFDKLQNHSYDFFANNFVGSLVNKVNRFHRSAETLDDLLQFKIYPSLVQFLISIIIIAIFAPRISLVLTVWIIIFAFGVFFLVRKLQLPLDEKMASVYSKTTAALADPITNNIAIKMFSREKYELFRFNKATHKLLKTRKKAWYMHCHIEVFQSFMMTALQMIVLYMIIKMWLSNQISVGTIVLINTYLASTYVNLWQFGNVTKNWNQALADAQEMTDILNTPKEIKNIKNPKECKISKGKIEFKNVCFAYDNEPIFEKFNLKIEPGEKVGLVGESGTGKTTITKLLLRFADIGKGEILIDNQNISQLRQEDLRKKISFVPQESILFHRTLSENIQYGDLNADKEKIIEAAKKANAHEFITQTPNSYETLVGERGIKLSGGERQRVSIARAMLKNAPILILDEATASLDSKSEKFIRSALDKVMENRTTIIIAHRLSTLKKMDRIIVLDEGNIIEEGSHAELLKKKGKYAELWKHQTENS